MSLENAKVLHKHFLKIGRKDWAKQQEKNYPELKQKPEEPVLKKETPKETPKEVPKKDGKKSKG